VGISDIRRKYSDKWDPESTDHYDWGGGFVTDELESYSSYTGRIKKIDWQNTFYVFNKKSLKDTLSFYLQNELILWNCLYLVSGLRVEDPDEFGGKTTYNVGISYHFKITDVDPEDKEHHRRIERVPPNQWSASLFYNFKDKLKTFLSAIFVGDRVDRYSADHPKVYWASSYTVVDGKISYNISPNFELFLRGENILDRDYEEIKGYEAPHAQWYFGIKAKF